LRGKARDRRKKRHFMRKASSDGVRTRQIEAMGGQFAQKREKEAVAGSDPAKERVRLIFQ